jgi:hypothetical protein
LKRLPLGAVHSGQRPAVVPEDRLAVQQPAWSQAELLDDVLGDLGVVLPGEKILIEPSQRSIAARIDLENALDLADLRLSLSSIGLRLDLLSLVGVLGATLSVLAIGLLPGSSASPAPPPPSSAFATAAFSGHRLPVPTCIRSHRRLQLVSRRNRGWIGVMGRGLAIDRF